MIVITVVTDTRKALTLTPLEEWIGWARGLPNLYLGTELPRFSSGSGNPFAKTHYAFEMIGCPSPKF
jgi:hypothetical protein